MTLGGKELNMGRDHHKVVGTEMTPNNGQKCLN